MGRRDRAQSREEMGMGVGGQLARGFSSSKRWFSSCLFLGMQGVSSPPEGLLYKRPWRLSHFLAVTLGRRLSGLLGHGDISPDGSLRASGGRGNCQII